mmetsp:Transcript_4886/g.4134  ORF Transcript_4886/g.4134 Transcript_4886/m.4134 type:complete len:226 (+) Transcript_4886:225-902(+)
MRSSKSPIMIEENYKIEETFDEFKNEDLYETIKQEKPINLYGKLHIFVLVHGMGGSQIDLLAFKNYITSVNQNVDFILSKSNSGEKSHEDINELAKNLADEVETDIEFHDIRNIDKISFVGFSLGGVIIRAALPLISKYKSKFYSYMSLATPHLGVKLKKKYIAAGIWFMKMFFKSKSLEQLNLEDSNEIQDTFMYKLSKSEGLSWFKKVYLLASSQDTYAPFGS